MPANDIKVSIIIPVFNVEKYIEQCATSLFEQTYQNIEFIFVNDASTDGSLAALYRVASKYNHRNIKISTNEKNSGSSATRNAGIKQATGQYITFCDSDDWMEHTAVEEMVNTAISHDADVVVTPFFTNTFHTEKTLHFTHPHISDLNSIPISFQYFSLWNKLIRSSILHTHGISFLPGIDCWEDLSVIARIYALNPKVVLLDRPFYHYRKYEYHSLTSHSHERQLADRLKNTEYLIQWFEQHNLHQKYEMFLLHLKFMSKIKMLRTKPRQYRCWKSTFPESNRYIMQYTDIPLHYRLAFLIAHIIIR